MENSGGKKMIIEKIHVGTVQLNTFEISYYEIKKQDFYGIEVQERYNDKLLSQCEYFTEDEKSAKLFAERCFNGLVTQATLLSLLDDFISDQEAILV